MIQVVFPEVDFKIKEEGGKTFIFCLIRKIWLMLTEEEWVRQHFVQYLVQALQYPKSLIALEKELQLNELKKRFDILVYDPSHRPWMLVECKAPEVELNEVVLQQVLRYHMSIPATYIVITNGRNTFAWKLEAEGWKMQEALPAWRDT